MKGKRCWTAVRFLLISVILMGGVTPGVLAQNNDDRTTGRIVYINPENPPGKLKVKQGKGEKIADATIGMPVRRRYILTLAAEAKAAVMCADKKKHDLLPGPQGCPCVEPKPRIFYDGSPIPRPRGNGKSNDNFPIILSPRHTWLLTTRPTIRWMPVAGQGEVTYRITIYTDTMEPVWRREVVSQKEMQYPADADELVRGEVYKVIVQAGQKSSEQERGADLTFTVLNEAEAKNIKAGEESIDGLNLPEAETQFLIADFYAANGLRVEALEKLSVSEKALRQPTGLRMLGDLYTEMGLTFMAVRRYEAALALLGSMEFKSDLEGRALTLAALGRAYEAMEDIQKSKLRLNEAVVVFKQLGDTVTVEQLRNGRHR
jgi:hypothetical protein